MPAYRLLYAGRPRICAEFCTPMGNFFEMRRRGGILQDGAPVYSMAAEKSSGPLTRPALEDLARTPLLLRQGGGDDGHGIGPQNLILRGPGFLHCSGRQSRPSAKVFPAEKRLSALRAPHRRWGPGLFHGRSKKAAGLLRGPPRLSKNPAYA